MGPDVERRREPTAEGHKGGDHGDHGDGAHLRCRSADVPLLEKKKANASIARVRACDTWHEIYMPHFVRSSFSTFRISTWIFVQCALLGTGVSLPSTGCTSQRFSRASRPCFRQESEEMGTSVRRRNRRNCWWSDCRSGPANAELCELRQVSEKSCKTLEHSRLTGQTWW